jgi:hydrogenase maturation protease
VSPRVRETATADHPPRTAVIGVGNLLLKDEGVGIHVIQALQKSALKATGKLAIIDGGTCPDAFDLVPEGIDKLVVVDAVKGGGEPGAIYRFTPEDIAFHRGPITSLHHLGLAEGLNVMAHAGLTPREVVIVGVEPKEIGWGLEMSPELQRKIPQIIDLVAREIGG